MLSKKWEGPGRGDIVRSLGESSQPTHYVLPCSQEKKEPPRGRQQSKELHQHLVFQFDGDLVPSPPSIVGARTRKVQPRATATGRGESENADPTGTLSKRSGAKAFLLCMARWFLGETTGIYNYTFGNPICRESEHIFWGFQTALAIDISVEYLENLCFPTQTSLSFIHFQQLHHPRSMVCYHFSSNQTPRSVTKQVEPAFLPLSRLLQHAQWLFLQPSGPASFRPLARQQLEAQSLPGQLHLSDTFSDLRPKA